MEKTYETINCECGHECPVEFAISNDEGQWTCPNCYEEYVHDLVKTVRDRIVCSGKCAIETAAKCTLVGVSKCASDERKAALIAYQKWCYEHPEYDQVCESSKVDIYIKGNL